MYADRWRFHNPVDVRFGAGRLSEVAELVTGHTLLVTTPGATRRGLTRRVKELLNGPSVHDGVEPNLTMQHAGDAIAHWRGQGIQTVVGIGGGSAIDLAKTLSLALAIPELTIARWLEPNPPWEKSIPLRCIAIPTTAGTGAEVTPTATLWDPIAKRKLTVSATQLHPTAAIVDPALTMTLPWSITLSTGLDAYSQCFEAVCNRRATPITTAIAEHGLLAIPAALRALQRNPGSLEARTVMCEAALCSGLAISITRTGLAHSMSYPLTAHYGLPHGLACGVVLPGVLRFNAAMPYAPLARVAELMGLASSDELVHSIIRLYEELDVASHVVQKVENREAFGAVEAEMLTMGRADNNVRSAGKRDIAEILDFTAHWLAGREGRR